VYHHLYTAPLFISNSRDGTQLGTVQFPHKGTKDVIKIDAITPTLPHTPDLQHQCWKGFFKCNNF